MDRDALIEFLSQNLELVSETTSEYTGAMDGGALYKDSTTIALRLCGKVIREVYVP